MKEKLKAYITDNFKSKMAYARHYGVDYNNLLAIFKDKNPRPVTQAYAATIKDGNIYVREDETLIKFKVYKDEKARRGK
jgi:hypothetical protein